MLEDSNLEQQDGEQQDSEQQEEAPAWIIHGPQAVRNAFGTMCSAVEGALRAASLSRLWPWYQRQVDEAQQRLQTAGSGHQQREAQQEFLITQRVQQSLKQPECMLVFLTPEGKVSACC
jgi:hypothetical protein